jgi:coenzyme PQQ biosynthesis protein PqqD
VSETCYALSRHAALKIRHHGSVLVLPERALRLEGSGGEILALVDGRRTQTEITRILDARYPGTEGLAEEVDRFLNEMRSLGGLVATDGAGDPKGAAVTEESR